MQFCRYLLLVTLALMLYGCKETLYSKLSEIEANEVKAALLAVGVPSEKLVNKDGTYSINIDSDHFDRAVRGLRAVNLPNESFSGLRETFKKQGLVASPTEERAKMMLATAQELERTLKQIDGVVTARVHVTIPPPNALAEKPADPSVAIMIKHRDRLQLDKMIPAIKVMAVNAVDGVKAEYVSVLAVRAVEFEALREGVAEPTLPPVIEKPKFNGWLIGVPGALAIMLTGLFLSPFGKRITSKIPSRKAAKPAPVNPVTTAARRSATVKP
jgi:type III secretion protein J